MVQGLACRLEFGVMGARPHRVIRSPLAWMCAAIVTVLAGCFSGAMESLPPAITSPALPSATPTAAVSTRTSASPVLTGCGGSTISIEYLPYTTVTLVGYGMDFVVADVVDVGPAFFNTPDGRPPEGFPKWPRDHGPNGNAEDTIYTPIDVDIDQVMAGSWRPGLGRVLVEGGTVAVEYNAEGKAIHCFTERASPVPQVVPGSRYVFILSKALDNGGEQYLPLKKANFAWPVSATGSVPTPDGPMTLDELSEVVRAAASSPEAEPTAAT